MIHIPSFEEEAFNRARQLHGNARQNFSPMPQPESKTEERKKDISEQSRIPADNSEPANPPGITDVLFKDKEQSLVLLLLILLMEENTEPTLLLALIYLLM